MRNARRDGRHREEGLCEVGLRETVKKGGPERRHHPDRMTGRAVATFVERVGRVVLRTLSDAMVLAIVAAHIRVMMLGALRRGVTVLAVIVRRAGSHLRRLRCAKRHGRGRVALKGHREHHEPQQDCAEIGHR